MTDLSTENDAKRHFKAFFFNIFSPRVLMKSFSNVNDDGNQGKNYFQAFPNRIHFIFKFVSIVFNSYSVYIQLDFKYHFLLINPLFLYLNTKSPTYQHAYFSKNIF